MKTNQIPLSVVIAAFNEENTIGEVIRRSLGHLPPGSEVLVVDDGSKDETATKGAAAGARVVSLGENRGKGVALRRGIAEARGRILVFIDGDGQDDPAEIPFLVREIETGADFVNGSRFLGEFRAGAITPLNRLGNLFMTAMVNLLFRTRITDSQAGFRAVVREKAAAMRLEAVSYEIETEMLIQAIRGRLKIVEVPVIRERRGGGATHFKRIRNGLGILFTIFRQRLSPGKVPPLSPSKSLSVGEDPGTQDTPSGSSPPSAGDKM